MAEALLDSVRDKVAYVKRMEEHRLLHFRRDQIKRGCIIENKKDYHDRTSSRRFPSLLDCSSLDYNQLFC